MFKIGVIINPFAGIGGTVGLKGSDGQQIVSQALAQGAKQKAGLRAAETLRHLQPFKESIDIFCYAGAMGESVVAEAGLSASVIGRGAEPSCAEDTIAAARQLCEKGVDLIVFAGGDGTARDIFTAVGHSVAVLGIPAGVKMHSGVYAVSPAGAGEILVRMVSGRLVDVGLAEVRDIDEDAFRQGRVSAKFYGELLVPREGRFLQQVKSSGREVEALVVQDIGVDIVESMEDDRLYLIGPGSTPSGIMDELGLDNTLLGVDAVFDRRQLGKDLSENQLLALLAQYPEASIVVTAIGGQGHVFGRGNQQLSAEVIARVGIENLVIIATKTKITELKGRPLLVDTGDADLDARLSGYRQVITGYHDAILYPVGLSAELPEDHSREVE